MFSILLGVFSPRIYPHTHLYLSQISDLHQKISLYEAEVKHLIESGSGRRSKPSSNDDENEDPTTEEDRMEAATGNTSDDDLDEEVEEHYATLEYELTHIIADVHDLGGLTSYPGSP